MNLKEATEIVTEKGFLNEEGEAHDGNRVDINDHNTMGIEGIFDIQELEAIVVYVKHRENL